MSTFSETMQKIVNLSDEEKVGLAATSYLKIMPVLKAVDTKTNGMVLLCAILGSAAMADGKINPKEHALISAILSAENLELSTDQVTELIRNSSGTNVRELVQKLSSAMNAEQKAALVSLVAAVSSIDDTISKDELSYIVDLIK